MWNLLCPTRRNKRVDMLSPYKWHKLLISPVIGTGIPRSVRWHFFEPNKMSANPNSTITTGRLVALRIQAIKVEIKDMTSTTREVAFRFQKEVTTSGRISTFTSDIFSRNLTGESELGHQHESNNRIPVTTFVLCPECALWIQNVISLHLSPNDHRNPWSTTLW